MLVNIEERSDSVEQLMREKALLLKQKREAKEVVQSFEERVKLISSKAKNGKAGGALNGQGLANGGKDSAKQPHNGT